MIKMDIVGFICGPRCPQCGSRKSIIPIIYGLVDYDEDDKRRKPRIIRKAEKGKIILGGCVIKDDSNHYYCKNCKKGFS